MPRKPLAALLAALPLVVNAADAVPAERELDLAIYEAGVALVGDTRMVALPAERGRLRWGGVAATIQPSTLRLDASGTELLAYRRADRPLDLAALVRAHEGREVRVRLPGADELGGATIVSADPLLVRTEAGVRSVDARQLVFPRGVPDELGGAPALALDVAGPGRERRRPVTLAYLADGLRWSLDYAATLAADGERMRLSARASISNDTGMDIRDARAELIAGSPRIPDDGGQPRARALQAESMAAAAADAGEPQAAGEYYRLALASPVTLAAGESASWTLFRREGIALDRVYVLRAAMGFHGGRGTSGWERVPLATTLAWTVGDGPQPGGTIRFYEPRPGDGSVRLLGGAELGDRAEGESVEVAVGRPFDVTAERRRTAYERSDDGKSETITHEIRLRNARDRAAAVRVEETIGGDWTMLQSSDDWEKAASNLAVWRVDVPAGGERVIRYRARIER